MRYDLIVSNPPYLTDEETTAAAPEVRQFEPLSALVSSDEGMADLKAILSRASDYLQPGGWVALETGIAQHDALVAFAAAKGLTQGESKDDLTGRNRYVFARRAS